MRLECRSRARLYSTHSNQTRDAKHVSAEVDSEPGMQNLNQTTIPNEQSEAQTTAMHTYPEPPLLKGGWGIKTQHAANPKL